MFLISTKTLSLYSVIRSLYYSVYANEFEGGTLAYKQG